MDRKTITDIIQEKIKEIEQITSNFSKPAPIYEIDIDLALSKVRTLYNELLQLKAYNPELTDTENNLAISQPEVENDNIEQPIPDEKKQETKNESPSDSTDQELITEKKESVKKPDPEINTDTVEQEDSFELMNENAEDQKEDVSETENFEKVEDKKEVIEEEPVKEITEEEPVKEPEKEKNDAQVNARKAAQQQSLFDNKKQEKTIGEQFSQKKDSINDIIAKFKDNEDLATRLKYKPIKDMNSAFSLNDKIMIIKELFNSDADSCNDFIAKVNNSSNYEEAITMVKEKFTNMEESESLEKFIEITYRRFME